MHRSGPTGLLILNAAADGLLQSVPVFLHGRSLYDLVHVRPNVNG